VSVPFGLGIAVFFSLLAVFCTYIMVGHGNQM
jgi:hypothetical protein